MTPSSNELAYLSGVAKRSQLLPREQELELARRFRDLRDQRAADQLVRCHFRMVIAMALKYRHYGIAPSELVAEGNCGLVAALSRFDPERGHRFATYAQHWVRAYMLEHVAGSWRVAGSGATRMKPSLFFKLRRERARTAALMGTGAGAEEALAERMSLSVARLRALLHRLDSHDVTLEPGPDSETRGWHADFMVSEETPEDSYLRDERRAVAVSVVSSALEVLDKREAYIVRHRLMADSEMSLAEIARSLGISRERARQLESRARKKLTSCSALNHNRAVRELFVTVREPCY
jgi:RNA polymerase sigma-32 factor